MSVGKAGRTTVRLADLIEDLDVYPRDEPSDYHVSTLVQVIQSGHKLPPLIVEADTLRIVDGFHRRRAYFKTDGPDAAVNVELRTYDTEAELLADAIQLNLHGLPLKQIEKRRIVFRLADLGVDDGDIARILRVPPPRVEKIRIQVATVVDRRGHKLRIEPLKPSAGHLMGQTMTVPQAKAHRTAPGSSYQLIIRQLRDALENRLIPENGKTDAALEALRDSIDNYLIGMSEVS